MGKPIKPPPFACPQELDARVYKAFMGHAPRVAPPQQFGLDAWQKWPVLRDFKGPGWQRLRRFCNESVLNPRVRDHLAPLLTQARKRWTEARERLEKGIERSRDRHGALGQERKNGSLK